MPNNRKFAIAISAINEEQVLAKTLESIIKIISPRDVYLADEDSQDNTYRIAKH